jgi:Fe-S-cluster containining protein
MQRKANMKRRKQKRKHTRNQEKLPEGEFPQLPQLTWSTKQAECPTSQKECCRSGQCCQVILLSSSPGEMEREYRRWLFSGNDAVEARSRQMSDIHLLYPMLSGTCRGKWKHPDHSEPRYVYGPCRHFQKDPDGKAVCLIHHVKPYMCYAFPFYRTGRQTEMAAQALGPNPGYMRGCGYNTDPKDGFRLEDFEKLTPLESHEQEQHIRDQQAENAATAKAEVQDMAKSLSLPTKKKR